MKEFYILNHLGLGDHIITNGLTRFYARLHEMVTIPCYIHNYNAVSFMFRDNKNIYVHPVKTSQEVIDFFDKKDSLKLGYYSNQGFDSKNFDKEFYRQAGVPFAARWDLFYIDLPVYFINQTMPTAFLHEDIGRGFIIDRNKVKLEIVLPRYDGQFFDNYHMMKCSQEIHCINSSFLHFWDSMPEVEGQKLFYHRYARPNGDDPTLKKKWEIL